MIYHNLRNPNYYFDKLEEFQGDRAMAIQWIFNAISPLDTYYSKYIAWLRQLIEAIPFKQTWKAYLQVEFEYWNKSGAKIGYTNPNFEILLLLYNLACVLFAKGLLLIYGAVGKLRFNFVNIHYFR